MEGMFKVPAPVSEKRRSLKRPLSPQPSTSSAPDPPLPPNPDQTHQAQPDYSQQQPADPFQDFPDPATEVRRILDVVLHNIQYAESARFKQQQNNLNYAARLRGVQPGRRRRDRLWQKYRQAKDEFKYTETIRILEPLLMEEITNQQRRHILIERALSNFADTINHIADKLEGKVNTEYDKRLAEYNKRANEFRAKFRALHPHLPEFPAPLPQFQNVPEEELNRLLREETKAAVEAILSGDKTKEAAPNNFAKIFEQLKML